MNKSKRSQEFKAFNSFADLRSEFGLPPLRMQTKNKEKLKSQRENFISKHVCPVCGGLLTFVTGTNMMVCNSKECAGITKTESYDEETGDRITYTTPYYEELDEHSAKIAKNIFAELD